MQGGKTPEDADDDDDHRADTAAGSAHRRRSDSDDDVLRLLTRRVILGRCPRRRLAWTGALPRPLRLRRPRLRLARPEARPRRRRPPPRSALVVEEVMTDWCGEIVAVDRDLDTLTLEDRRGKRRTFPLGPGFLLEGRPVILTRPVRAGAPATPTRTASGSVAVHGAQGPRGPGQPDLRRGPPRRRAGREGLGRRPAHRGRRRGVPRRRRRPRRPPARLPARARSAASACWSTTWSPGSKESRIAAGRRRSPVGKHVLVVGHPFVDVWQAVKPERLGIDALARRPAQHRVEDTASASSSAGRTATRPTSPAPGSTSSSQGDVVRRPRARRCSAGSRS